MKNLRLVPVVFVLAAALFAAACSTVQVRFVHKVRAPERGGTLTFTDYAEDDARDTMKDYCGKRGYVVLEEGEGVIPLGTVSGGSIGVAGRTRAGEKYVTFKCKPKASES